MGCRRGVPGSLVLCLAVISATVLLLPAQEGSRPERQTPQRGIRAVADAVIVDLVVRDQRGRTVNDLRLEEVEVYEDGVRQEIISFRRVDTTVTTEVVEDRPPGQAPDRPSAGPSRPVSSHPNLVTLVFERLGTEGRTLARQAALDFLSAELPEGMLAAVFAIDQRLLILQPFTQDRQLLRQAVERATSGAYSQFVSQSEAILQELETSIGMQEGAQAQVEALGRDQSPGGGEGAGFAAAQIARMTLNMLRFSESLQREQQGASSLFSLLSLIREQRRLAGRKTVIYFSEGLQVPPHLVEVLRTTISEANRSNVSVYSIDARGLTTGALTTSSRQLLEQVAATNRTQVSQSGRAVTREQVMAAEDAEASLRMNVQGTLEDLAKSTGGFLIANTNDFRGGMTRIREDIATYYELAYMPKEITYDGRFRQISVSVARTGVSVQSRSGYFALPPTDGPPVLPYEIPLLTALSSNILPKDFDYHVRTLRFAPGAGGVQHSVAMEVPLSSFRFTENRESNTYQTHFSLMILIKDAQAKVVEKFSQDYPLEGPLERLEALKKGNIIFMRHFRLQPGRYTLEAVALDRETDKRSARRVLLMVPAGQGLQMSSLAVIGKIDPVPAEDRDTDNPFQVGSMKIIPDISPSVEYADDGSLSFFLVIYPSQDSRERPRLTLQFIRDGELAGQGSPELPEPDEEGRIPYVATVPLKTLKPGRYEIRAVVQQEQSVRNEYAFLNIVP